MSAQPSLFDRPLAERLADRGIAIAEANRENRVALARNIGEDHARLYGTVTSDDVRLHFKNLSLEWIGNAAGSIFRDPRFEFTGQRRKSAVVIGHGNMIRVWRLRDR